MEQTIKIFIYIHAFFGGIGLITGIGSIIVKKGSSIHKKFGKLFSFGMLTSSLIIIPIAWMPNHQNLFLFLIALFTIYLVLSGNRALTFKSKKKILADITDKLISGIMWSFSAFMFLFGIYGLIKGSMNHSLFVFFGVFGLLLTTKDFIYYRRLPQSGNTWIMNHLTKMIGALIASFTAFIVAGLGIGTFITWMLPTVLGTGYIIYWKRKMKAKIAPV